MKAICLEEDILFQIHPFQDITAKHFLIQLGKD